MPDRGAALALLALSALFLLALLFGAWTGFPVYNDAFLVGFLRELGAGNIAADFPDQPLYGFLLQWLAMAFGRSRAPYIAIGLASWILLSWQTIRLWSRLFPEQPRFGFLAALLVISPILVETQYTTVTATLRANLPVSLCLAALLVCLGSRDDDRRSLVLSAALVLVAAALTEYGVATMAASVALLLVLRRLRSAGALFAGGAVGYVVFRIISDVQTIEYVDPSVQLPKVLNSPGTAATQWISGVWHCLLGAWLSAAGALRVFSGSRSTLVAAAAGLLSAVAVARALRGLQPAVEKGKPARRLAALCVAVAVGLLPVVLAGQSTVSPESNSRHKTHVLAFAAIAVVAIVGRVVAARFRPAVFVFLAFLAGYSVVEGAFKTNRRQRFFEQVGVRLLPLVKSSSGITVAVLPWTAERTDLTHRITFRWGDEELKRVGLFFPDQATKLFGPRVGCHDIDRIDARLGGVLRSMFRKGPVSHLVWVPFEGQVVGDPEPYCVEPVRPTGPVAAVPRP